MNDVQGLDDIIELLSNANQNVFKAVNEVYYSANGTYINVESDITAADILSLLVKKFCIEAQIFDRIYILFDEFGRYIEFTANKPHIAGDASLQQIFEAIQNSEGYIIFNAFIQYELKTYIRLIEGSNANLKRYVDRYDNSDKYHLTSNSETVLANLIEKKDEENFDNIIAGNIIGKYYNYQKTLFTQLQSWAAPEIKNRNVWTNEELYFDTIAKGCYPLHPITVWFLSNTSEWMQQRSTIAYTAEMFDSIKSSEISYNWLRYIYPIDLLSTGMFDEMLNSEEKGIAKSHDCLAYQAIIIKNKGKFTENQIKVLKAVLICNILQFKFFDRNSCINGIRYCSGLQEDDVNEALKGEKGLENYSCVLSFDESTNRFDINAEAHGKQEYTLCVSKKTALMRNYDAIANIDDDLKCGMGILSPEPTSFAQDNFINSAEWKFEQRIVNIASINEQYCYSLIYHLRACLVFIFSLQIYNKNTHKIYF